VIYLNNFIGSGPQLRHCSFYWVWKDLCWQLLLAL